MMWIMIMLKFIKSQGFNFSLEENCFEKQQWGWNWKPLPTPAILGLTKEQSVLIKIRSSFKGENMQT